MLEKVQCTATKLSAYRESRHSSSSACRLSTKNMSGLVKAKKYDWKDTNLALFGSDTEKQVKKESAESEPAWHGCGQAVGLKIWRIVKFEVTDWPEQDYGKFYSGDSYIVLNTYKPDPDSEELAWDLHFWIGSKSSQDEYGSAAYKTVELDTFLDDGAVQHREDEYGTAAYKTVELDTFLDDGPVQHREVEGHESQLFKSYFKNIVIMEGGADTGFRHVTPEEYRPRLLHFSGQKRHITVKEVPLCSSRLNSNDVFILDLGLKLYQWNGTDCNKDERFKAMQFLSELKSERGNADSETLDQDGLSSTHDFYEALTGEDEEDEDVPDEGGITELYKVTDASGELSVEKVKDEGIGKDDLDSSDVFILDIGNECFVWIGSGASPSEKKNGLGYAHNHLMKTSHQLVPIVVVKEGQRNAAFETAMAA
ncbi:Gelsolin-like protein 2 [Lamellibrachia satsuma]|nr:Gelsolin-like protein 2 [Lamellibrachia satsuma]